MRKLKHIYILVLPALILSLLCGCQNGKTQKRNQQDMNLEVSLNDTIGNYAEMLVSSEIPIEGFGIVVGLEGSGSAECPPAIRDRVLKFIQQKLKNRNRRAAIEFLEDKDNSVVRVYGVLPSGHMPGQRFDVFVEPFASTQTISLENGRLLECSLYERSRVGIGGARTIALAHGQVYIDMIGGEDPNLLEGVVIGGGIPLEFPQIALGLFEPNFRLASILRNRINERFNEDTATAIGPGVIEIKMPKRYLGKYGKFASLVKTLYIPENRESLNDYLEALAANLSNPDVSIDTETALEAVGRPAIPYLLPFLDSENQEKRFRAARLLLALERNEGIDVLHKFATDPEFKYRVEAVEALALADKDFVRTTVPRFLNDDDFEIRMAAFRILEKINDINVSMTTIGGSFKLSNAYSKGKPAVYISRSQRPEVIIFGDVRTGSDVFVRSDDNTIFINSSPQDDSVSLSRKHPSKPNLIGPLKTSAKLEDIIIGLCSKLPADDVYRIGLQVNYSQMTSLVKKMFDMGIIEGELVIGPVARRPSIPSENRPQETEQETLAE
ncbi:Basal body P-ring protein [Limihaloglobus sulfuriphilus]|uniref:Basal body P-ring protein n=1 Tax=Limihaloglobus sulfuriphilus TaxID=1851148 RepID=A0A1Q2MDU1_9BACT|nr:flagellar basal body P-ring protein FlgI [Limihaloglobus sulfuriphilus]AQQ70840.1 Basal body P-ring protein [Limihaloglobus sulfuriphilus]